MHNPRRALVVLVLLGCWFSGASLRAGQGNSVTRTFAAGGRVRMDLSAGAYMIRAGRDTKVTAGDLRIRGLSGNKRVESWVGNIDIDVGRPEDYGSVHASVTAGELLASPFNATKGGLFRSLSWTGPGRYRLDVRLTAGDLRLR